MSLRASTLQSSRTRHERYADLRQKPGLAVEEARVVHASGAAPVLS
jgi:hypothetical protein